MSAQPPLEAEAPLGAVVARPAPARTPSPWLRALAVARLVAGALMITAILSQLAVSLGYWQRIGIHDVGLRMADFFSAFTHQVNLAAGAVLIVGAFVLLRGDAPEPGWYSVLRLAVLPSLLAAGIVYNVLLRSQAVPPGSQLDWANEVMHVVAPLLFLVDWVVAPHPRSLRFRSAAVVVILPLAWLAYTFLRGPLVPDEINRTPYYYPYPFLDPHASGWAPVVQLVGELLVFAVILGLLAVLVWRIEDRDALRRRRAAASS
jgi:hypothetical protein